MAAMDDATYVREVVAKDPWAARLGLETREAGEGRALLALRPRPEHLNGMGRVHGGALCALAEHAVAVAANATRHPALVYECKVNFLAEARPEEELLAEARCLSRGGRLALWEVRVTAPDGGLKAVAQGVTYHRPDLAGRNGGGDRG